MSTDGFNQTDNPLDDSATTNRNTFEAYMLANFANKVKKVFDVKKAFISQSTDFWVSLKKAIEANESKSPDNQVHLPVAKLKISGLDSESRTYNAATLRRLRKYGNVNTNSSTRKAHSLLPTNFEIDVTLYTQSLNELLYYANKWRFGVLSADLNFTVEFDGIDVDIKVIPQTQFQFPEKDEEGTRPAMYEATATFTIIGYMSDAMGVDKAPDFPVLRELNIDHYLVGQDPEKVEPMATNVVDMVDRETPQK